MNVKNLFKRKLTLTRKGFLIRGDSLVPYEWNTVTTEKDEINNNISLLGIRPEIIERCDNCGVIIKDGASTLTIDLEYNKVNSKNFPCINIETHLCNVCAKKKIKFIEILKEKL